MDKLKGIEVMREKMNPRVTLPVSMIKAAKDWKVGEEYAIRLEVKQVRMEEQYEGEDLDVTFEILKAKACSEEGMEEEEDDDEMAMLKRIEKNTRGFATA